MPNPNTDLETLEKQLATAETRAEEAKPEELTQIGALAAGLRIKIGAVRRRAQEAAAAVAEKAAQAAELQAKRERQAAVEGVQQEAVVERERSVADMDQYARLAVQYDALWKEVMDSPLRQAGIQNRAHNLGLDATDLVDMSPSTLAYTEARQHSRLHWPGK